MRKSLRIAALGTCALLAGPLALPSAADGHGPGPTPVVEGVVGPLHVSYRASDDRLLVADAFASTVYLADPATGEKVPAPGGRFAPGTFVTSVDTAQGGFYATIGAGAPDAVVNTRLVKVDADGERRVVANLLRYEQRNNPDGQPQGPGDALSNPYDVLAVKGGALVADAAGNAVLSVSDSGRVRTLTVLPVSRRGECAERENNGVPNGGCDPVPTDLAMGADGFLYVSGLGAEVEGQIWKIDPDTGEIVRSWRRLPPLTGVAVDRRGNVYASSLFTGQIFRITPEGRRSSIAVPGPTGLALHSARLYVGSVDLAGGPGSVVELGTWAFDQ